MKPVDEGAIEAVARAICKDSGRDPDELVAWDWCVSAPQYKARWWSYSAEARRFIVAHTALWEHMRVSARKKEWQAP